MTSAKQIPTAKTFIYRFSVWGIATLLVVVGIYLFSPAKTAGASTGVEYTQSVAGEDKVEQTIKSLDSLTISEPTITADTTVNGSSLAPPPGLDAPLPSSTASGSRKLLPKQDIRKNRWVEVDISRQRIWLWDGSKLVDSYLVSTGIPGHDTPLGTYRVYLNIRSQTMSGPGYSLPNVQWVKYFTGDYSLHSTWWHNNFGYRMSHGCINLPTPKAESLWSWAPSNLKVVIHE